MKVAALAIAATLAGTSLAAAQSVEFRVGPTHERAYVDRHHHRDWRDSRAYYRDRGDTVVIKKKRYYDSDRGYRHDHGPGVTFRTW